MGERIVEYVGVRMTHAEADAVYPDDGAAARHHTFLFAIDDRIVIDAARGGNESRFINHSCSPNCEIVISHQRVFIHALRDIEAGEELSYDYWYVTDARYTIEDLRRIYPCRCGAASCRGTLARPPRPNRRRRTTRIK